MPNSFEARFNQRVISAATRGFGVDVTMTRGNYTTEPLRVRRDDRVYKAMGAEFGVEVSITMRDFYVPVAEVVFDGGATEPRPGDRITEGQETFEIQPPDDNTPPVELLSGGYEYLVHTKRIQ